MWPHNNSILLKYFLNVNDMSIYDKRIKLYLFYFSLILAPVWKTSQISGSVTPLFIYLSIYLFIYVFICFILYSHALLLSRLPLSAFLRSSPSSSIYFMLKFKLKISLLQSAFLSCELLSSYKQNCLYRFGPLAKIKVFWCCCFLSFFQNTLHLKLPN